ncbi:MAG: hypothetical protein II721_01785, partial [Bacilli bacterium]|nr:hypothetical protein [Bacilli bacterium]
GIALLMEEQIRLNGKRFEKKLIKLGRIVFGLDSPFFSEVKEAFHDWILSLPIYHSFEELPFEINPSDIEESRKILIETSKF